MNANIRNLRIATAFAVFLLAAAGPDATGQTAATSTAEPIESVVRSVFHHGIPYALLRSQGPEAVPKLIEMLGQTTEKEHWANVVWALGVIGDPKATKPLVEFLENRFEGEVDPPTWQALVVAPQSLGLLAAESTEAFRFLDEGVTRDGWRRRELRWTYPTLGEGDRELLMIKLSVNGLGMSGTSQAEERLKSLARVASEDRRLWTKIRPNVEEAVVLNEKIRSLGHQAVFEQIASAPN